MPLILVDSANLEYAQDLGSTNRTIFTVSDSLLQHAIRAASAVSSRSHSHNMHEKLITQALSAERDWSSDSFPTKFYLGSCNRVVPNVEEG